MSKKKDDIVYLVEDNNQPLLVEGQSAPILVEEQPSHVLVEGTPSTSDKTKRKKSRVDIETAESRAQEAERRLQEMEQRAQEAERKAQEAQEALRKRENAAEKRTKSASEQIPAQEVSVTNIANFANATRYLKELERTFEETTKSTKGQKD